MQQGRQSQHRIGNVPGAPQPSQVGPFLFCYTRVMNQWSRNRKRIILAILFFILVILVGLPAFLLFYEKPNCFDKKMNGDEAGVDCGGSCQLLCSSQSVPLILKGDPRVLTLATSTYQVVALVENSNNDAEIYKAGYTLKLYDSSNPIPVKTIEGVTFVPQGSEFAIFEGPINLESGIQPSKATLEWREDSLVWRKTVKAAPELTVRNTKITKEETSPTLEADIQNSSLEVATNIDLVALIADSQGNIFAASKTFIDALAPGGETKAIFTWPKPFGQEVVGIDIVVRIFPDRSFIR